MSAVLVSHYFLRGLSWRLHSALPVASGRLGGGAIIPRKMARKIFLSVSENKSSDRKLSLIPFVSAAPVWLNSDFEGLRTF